ncbi:glutaredoxin family protein [Paraburkholderia sp. SOS3]|uniref:glutaredoxin family protein n=1 Tax=Paraburkholderia sp. SOS3 TaxID=1926494 RepID=UPI000B2CD326|nr:glutaredoxin family protein [Paraburkholderia sp. SOS3]
MVRDATPEAAAEVTHATTEANPAASRAPLVFTLYGRAWCHLCDDMRAALEPLLVESGARVDVVDIDDDPALEARYNEAVPVLICDGVELCRYHLDAARVRAVLAARLNAPAS